jgi:predicted nucleic acid-binding protein
MILVDTSVWVNHLRESDPHLSSLLVQNRVLVHPWIVGEIACGSFAQRLMVVELLRSLPQLTTAGDEEVLFFLERHLVFGKGIGYIDAHLLTAAMIDNCKIWTTDKRMALIATRLNICYQFQQ